MDFKLSVVVFIIIFQVCSSSVIPSLKEPSVSIRFGPSSPNCTFEYLRDVFSSFPTADRARVHTLFNILDEIRAPKIPGRLETEEAEMELLHIMIFGATTNVPLTRWYLIFEKVVDTIDESLPNRDERMRLTETILQKYLTREQRRRLNIFTRILRRDVDANDAIILYTYLYGIPIGLSLGASEEEITRILESNQSIDLAANELANYMIQQCPKTKPFEFHEHSIRDLIKIMLTRR